MRGKHISLFCLSASCELFIHTYLFSGAGKTVSATHIMRYFATADDKDSGKVKDVTQGMTEVEEQIMGKRQKKAKKKLSPDLYHQLLL